MSREETPETRGSEPRTAETSGRAAEAAEGMVEALLAGEPLALARRGLEDDAELETSDVGREGFACRRCRRSRS